MRTALPDENHTLVKGNATDTAHDPAQRTDWSSMGDSDHFVQFYQDDRFLLGSLGGFIGTALRHGETAIVVATGDHRERLADLLNDSLVDLAGARASGRFIELDAATTLAS